MILVKKAFLYSGLCVYFSEFSSVDTIRNENMYNLNSKQDEARKKGQIYFGILAASLSLLIWLYDFL